MPSSDTSVDVAALLDRSGLGGAGYKSFAAAESPTPAPAIAKADKSAAPPAAAPAHPTPVPASQPLIRTAGRLLTRATAKELPEHAAPAWDRLPTGHCLALTGVGGGAGAATILANAAAALAAFGERVAVADKAPSLLPFYFGGDNFRSGPATFAPPRASGAGPVHLVTGDADDSDGWLLHGLSGFRDDCDRILVNCTAGLSAEASRWTSQAAAVVVLLTPDPGSLLRLAGVLERLRRSSESEPHPLLLLNQFDAGSELHVNLRGELSRRFGEHLLPFVIEHDDAFAHCLAAGGTVTELAPQSRAAADIRTLVEWLRNYKFEAES